jgi:hypothetical protein
MGIMRRRMRRRAIVGGAAAAAVAYHAGRGGAKGSTRTQDPNRTRRSPMFLLLRRHLCPTGIPSTSSDGWANCTLRDPDRRGVRGGQSQGHRLLNQTVPHQHTSFQELP